MNREVYSAANEFVKGLKEVDPEYYKDINVRDVLPYFKAIVRKIDLIKS